ncbi:hypothetical protein [Oryzihumus leptocrescens]|uniref:Uncharacterized protein n=1 Tax=Oryzihumus leptocrescens TaxID=297536 RepID=A0A542Z7Z9_9MICO|nr:hypothetical protein [Oryzihumus leptocrescens]TQL56466.1 hypothetical protein FB474_4083 [Oryzihumus leptocrescens]
MLRTPRRLRAPRRSADPGPEHVLHQEGISTTPPPPTDSKGADEQVAVDPTAPEQVPVADLHAGTPELVVSRRRGCFVLTATDGTEVGVIQGDYVIGFTARYLGRARFIKDLDEAKDEITRAWLEQLGHAEAQPQAG